MKIIANRAKQRILNGELALGMGLRQARTVDIAQIAQSCDFDWLFIDMEHNSMSVDTAAQICQAALAVGITPMIRVPAHEAFHSTRLLDTGAIRRSCGKSQEDFIALGGRISPGDMLGNNRLALAGQVIEPSVSEPMAASTMPAPTAAKPWCRCPHKSILTKRWKSPCATARVSTARPTCVLALRS